MTRMSKITMVVVLFILIIPISVGAQPNSSNSLDLVTHCYPIDTGSYNYQLCIQINPLTNCEGWELGPVPPFGYQIGFTDTIYPYGHSIGIASWGPNWLSGTWIDDKTQESFTWNNSINIAIYFPGSVYYGNIPVSIPIYEPTTCGSKVTICHRDMGLPAYKEIEISKKALPAHLAHGDLYPDPVNGCDI